MFWMDIITAIKPMQPKATAPHTTQRTTPMSQPTDHNLTEVERAMVDISCVMLIADGELGEEEEDFLVGFLSSMFGVDSETAEALAQDSYDRMESFVGLNPIIDDIVARLKTDEDAERAFRCAVATMLADGEPTEGEQRVLGKLKRRLGYDGQTAVAIIHEVEAMLAQ